MKVVSCQREHLLQTSPDKSRNPACHIRNTNFSRRRRDGARFAHRKIALFLYYRGRRDPVASRSNVTQTNYTRRGRPLPRFPLCQHVYRLLCNWRYVCAARDGVIPRRRNKTGSVCLIYDAIFRIAWLNARSMIADTCWKTLPPGVIGSDPTERSQLAESFDIQITTGDFC